MDFLKEYMVPVIVGVCLCVGYIVKRWIRDMDNKYIPTLCAAVGFILAVWLAGWTITPAVILQGLFSGLASTGLHQAFIQVVENKGNAETEE